MDGILTGEGEGGPGRVRRRGRGLRQRACVIGALRRVCRDRGRGRRAWRGAGWIACVRTSGARIPRSAQWLYGRSGGWRTRVSSRGWAKCLMTRTPASVGRSLRRWPRRSTGMTRDPCRPALTTRSDSEADPAVLGSLATNLGRLTFSNREERAAADQALASVATRLPTLGDDPGLVARLGLARGIEAFARGSQGDQPLSAELLDATASLSSVSAAGNPGSDAGGGQALAAARIRRLATAALVHTGQLAPADAVRLLEDPDWGVRREVVIGTTRHGTAPGEVIPAGLEGPRPARPGRSAPRVRPVDAPGGGLRRDPGCDGRRQPSRRGYRDRVRGEAVSGSGDAAPGARGQGRRDGRSGTPTGAGRHGHFTLWRGSRRATRGTGWPGPRATRTRSSARGRHGPRP